MSVAFTKEGDYENAAAVDLPDRLISAHPNLVTADGMAALDAALALARADFAAHQVVEGRENDPRALARASRDLRYYASRVSTAKVMPLPDDAGIVRFGATVTILRDDGRRQTFRIVGEDEADPKAGTMSHASPLAASLMGKSEGESAQLGAGEVEIIAIA